MKKVFAVAIVMFTTAYNVNAQTLLDKLNSKKKQEEPKKEEVIKKEPEKPLAEPPKTVYTDQYDISGLYFLSRPSIDNKIVTALNVQFFPESGSANISFEEGGPSFTKNVILKAFDKIKYFGFRGYDGSGCAALDCSMLPIEKDLYLLYHKGWTVNYENCPETNFSDPNNETFIAGKNKERVAQIAADKELYTKLANQAFENYCIAFNQNDAYYYASNYPFPDPGMKDANVVAAATEGIKKQAAIAKWDEKIDYCYIKSDDWTVIKDKVTGEILYRTLRMIAVMSVNNECKWEEFSVKQDYQGGSWGKTTYNGNTKLIIPVDCEESKKHK